MAEYIGKRRRGTFGGRMALFVLLGALVGGTGGHMFETIIGKRMYKEAIAEAIENHREAIEELKIDLAELKKKWARSSNNPGARIDVLGGDLRYFNEAISGLENEIKEENKNFRTWNNKEEFKYLDRKVSSLLRGSGAGGAAGFLLNFARKKSGTRGKRISSSRRKGKLKLPRRL